MQKGLSKRVASAKGGASWYLGVQATLLLLKTENQLVKTA